jgi:type II secretory pathway pseudopilin PulG
VLTAAARRRRAADDAGITLIELIVSMTITTILMTFGIVFFVQAERSGYKSSLTNQQTADARLTLDSWTSMLRVAGWLDQSAKTDRFEEITPTKIVFYANLNNRNTADFQVGTATKVALMLRVTNAATGDGQLVEVVFKPNNTTPKTVRQVAVNASPTGGAPIFQPYNQIGGAVDIANTTGCKQGNTPVAGLCLQTPPAGAGMLDPTLAATGPLAVSAGPLRGNPALNEDSTLRSIAGITIAFTVNDTAHTDSLDFTSSASVNSGFPTS